MIQKDRIEPYYEMPLEEIAALVTKEGDIFRMQILHDYATRQTASLQAEAILRQQEASMCANAVSNLAILIERFEDKAQWTTPMLQDDLDYWQETQKRDTRLMEDMQWCNAHFADDDECHPKNELIKAKKHIAEDLAILAGREVSA
jgi:hypothetical protein